MTKHHFTVVLEREVEGGFHAFCPALKGCHSEGDTIEEAVSNAREAIEAYLESLTARGEPIPVEDLLIKPIEVAV
ncbi:MAG: type II toxin-antitoxin system HicB family antitoxin [Planctomycetia bacterium]|nr:type II toxin-antitoxin system HicB family antitoxin [Planctomycetia bacterium]